MPRYNVYFETKASTSVEVKAEDADDATEIADEEFVAPALCVHCTFGGHGQPGIDLGEWEIVDEGVATPVDGAPEPTWRVHFETTASTKVQVEAEDAAAAIDAADDAFGRGPQLCAYCALGGHGRLSIDLGEWEGSDDEPELVESA